MSTATFPSTAQSGSQKSLSTMLKSTGIVAAGTALLLPGFLGSMMLLTLDLSGVGLEDGAPMASPLGAVLQSPLQLWLAFAVGTLMMVAGFILVGSQPFCAPAAIAYIMCPMVSVAYLLGRPLRGDESWNRTAARAYAVIGVIASLVGAVVMMNGPTGQEYPIWFVGSGLMFQIGIAAVLAAILRLAKRPNRA